MPIINNLRQWKNGEIFSARDYRYERDAIVAQLNRLTLLLEGNQDGDGINIAVDQISVGNLNIDVNDRGALQVDKDSVKLQFGEQLYFRVRFTEGVTKGDAIQLVSSEGSDFLAKKAVQSEINENPELFLGLAANSYATGFYGLVLEFGLLPSMYLTGFPAGSTVWYNSNGSIPGTLTTVEPPRTKARIRIASVTNDQNASLGEWILRTQILEIDGNQTFLNNTEPQYPIEGDLWFQSST